MDGFPVTIRLIDPPLHEFVPHDRKKQEELAKDLGLSADVVARRVEQLHESNPMLGHRGCRLCITYPQILEMQVRAIIEAAIECKKAGVKVLPEIMHPLVLDKKEFSILEQSTRRKMCIRDRCGGMLESGIGRAHNIALSTLPNFALPGDVSASRRYWVEDIIEPEVIVSPQGTIRVPAGPGIGFEPRLDRIEKLTTRSEQLA